MRFKTKAIVMIRFLLTIVFFTGCLTIHAQDFKKAMQELQGQYAGMTSMHVVMEVNVYENRRASSPHYTMNVDIKKDGENYLYRLGNTDMLMNDQYLVVVDHGTKEIVYNIRDVKAEQKLRKNFKFDLDSILSMYDHAAYLGKVDHVHHYQVEEKQGGIKSTELFIRVDNGLLERITYEYETEQFVSIQFNTFTINPSFAQGSFSEGVYFINEGNRKVPSTNLRGYSVTKPN